MIKVSGAKTAAAVTPTLVAWYRFGLGITVTGAGVSKWADNSGNGNDLLQATDALRPAKQTDGSILFDGVNDYLKANAFTLNQPCTFYLLLNPISFTNNDYIFDGNTSNLSILYQDTTTPNISLYAGATAATNTNLTIGSYHAMSAVFNGASSLIQVDSTTSTTGNAGAQNPAGFTLGAHATAFDSNANIQVKEVLIYNEAHSAATRAQVISYLKSLGLN